MLNASQASWTREVCAPPLRAGHALAGECGVYGQHSSLARAPDTLSFLYVLIYIRRPCWELMQKYNPIVAE